MSQLERAMAPPPPKKRPPPTIQTQIEEEIYQSKSQDEVEEEEEEVASRCERLLHEFSGRVHPNHKLMIDVQSRLAEAYGSGERGVGPAMEEMSRPMMHRKMQACNQV